MNPFQSALVYASSLFFFLFNYLLDALGLYQLSHQRSPYTDQQQWVALKKNYLRGCSRSLPTEAPGKHTHTHARTHTHTHARTRTHTQIGGSGGKESACNAGDPGSIPGLVKDPLEKGMATLSSILAWRIPWTEVPGRLTVHGDSHRVKHDLATKPPPGS